VKGCKQFLVGKKLWRAGCDLRGENFVFVMSTTTSPLKAKDLIREAPRSPRERIEGYVLMARMIDKGRATLAGINGEFHFDCPVDNLLFSFKGLKGDDVRQVLATGASDDEVAEWINGHGTPKTKQEIEEWSRRTEQLSYFNVADKKEWFIGECRRLGLDPARSTLFDYLEADDRDTFKQVSS
jgi:hypothetical protein